MFASKSFAETLLDDIAELEVKSGNKEARLDNRRKIKRLQSQFEDEKKKGRVIDPLETESKALVPCYFNSGCGLYSDGLTCIEIANDKILLIKWSNFTSDPGDTPLRTVYDEAKLNDLMEKVLTRP
jgi:hypothetical protein